MVIQNFGSHKSTLTVHGASICFNTNIKQKNVLKSNQKYDDRMKNCISGKYVFPTKNNKNQRWRLHRTIQPYNTAYIVYTVYTFFIVYTGYTVYTV